MNSRFKVMLLSAFGIAVILIFHSGYWLCSPNNHSVSAESGFGFERIEIDKGDGNKTVAWYLRGTSEKGFVFAHGNSSDRNSMVKRMRYFSSLGYSVIAPDLNAHGETKGKRKSFGYFESKDVQIAARYLKTDKGVKWVGGIGTSLGGASILKSESEAATFDAIIIESVFRDIRTAAKNRLEMKLGKMGGYLSPLLTFQIPIWIGIASEEISPSHWAENCKAPALVLSGSLDGHAKPWESRAIFDNLKGRTKRIRIFEGARHQDLYAFDKDAYQREIMDFLASIKRDSSRSAEE